MGRHTYDCDKCKRTLVYYQTLEPEIFLIDALAPTEWTVGGI